jgi:hypothetical protein
MLEARIQTDGEFVLLDLRVGYTAHPCFGAGATICALRDHLAVNVGLLVALCAYARPCRLGLKCSLSYLFSL